MNTRNRIILDLVNELSSLLSICDYKGYGTLKNVSKPLFQWAFEEGILLMNKSIEDDQYYEIFTIEGSFIVFELSLIGLSYQEK